MELKPASRQGFEGLLGGSVAGVRGAGTVFLCFGVSGSTKGPFWPHPTIMPARHARTHKRTIFMPAVYRVGGARVWPELPPLPVCPTLQHLETMMKCHSRILPAILAVIACAASSSALASNPLGFYLGAGAGYSTIRSDDSSYGLPGYFNDHQAAWKAIAGVRPISLVGAEYEYIDFGQPGRHYGSHSVDYYGLDSHPRAWALFGMGYLPLPIPFFDVYGKAGVARLQTDVTTFETVPCAVNVVCPPIVSRHNQSDNKFAYGAGVQSRVWGVSFRAEYERISSQFGDPDALTVSATWTF